MITKALVSEIGLRHATAPALAVTLGYGLRLSRFVSIDTDGWANPEVPALLPAALPNGQGEPSPE